MSFGNGRNQAVHSKVRNLSLAMQGLLNTLTLSTFSLAQTQSVNASTDASKTDAPISKYIYGQFLEHNGGIINNNTWAEMLDDRKFYYPATSHPPARASRPKLPSHDSAPLDADWL